MMQVECLKVDNIGSHNHLQSSDEPHGEVNILLLSENERTEVRYDLVQCSWDFQTLCVVFFLGLRVSRGLSLVEILVIHFDVSMSKCFIQTNVIHLSDDQAKRCYYLWMVKRCQALHN